MGGATALGAAATAAAAAISQALHDSYFLQRARDVASSLSRTEEPQGYTYYRLETETRSAETARTQQLSGEIWGTYPRGGNFPAVQAYRGPLPPGARGIEFITNILPDSPYGPIAYWRGPREGVTIRDENGTEYAVLSPVVVTKNTQVEP